MADRDPGFVRTPAPGYVDIDPGIIRTPGPGYVDRDPGLTDGRNLPPRSTPPKPMPTPHINRTPIDKGNNPNRSVGNNIASTLFNSAKGYVTNLGRSARDIPTAFGTAMDSKGAMSTSTNERNKQGNLVRNPMSPIKNIGEQVAQYAGSVFGKKDNSRSSQYVTLPQSGAKHYIDSKTDKGLFLNNPAKLGK